jgi:hypothetical protein
MMKLKPIVVSFSVLVLLLLVTVSTLAMSSPNYRLDWFVPLSGGGGGRSGSTSYTVDYTVGQTAAGPSSSTGYEVGLGYWYGAVNQYNIFLPAVSKN